MEMRIELSQKQTITPKLIQNMEILQMSSEELERYVERLALENPMVEVVLPSAERTREEEREKKIEWLNSTDYQNRVYYTQDYSEERRGEWNFEENRGETLVQYLLSQIIGKEKICNREVLEYMIYSLDSKGYWNESKEEVQERFQIEKEEVENCKSVLQSLEPAGVGARNLRECLLLQLKRRKIQDEVALTIIKNYLEELGKNQLDVIAKKQKISIEQVKKGVEVIRSLNPKPGNQFSSYETLRYIIPEIIVVKFTNYCEVLLNEVYCPEIQINGYYKNLLKQDCEKETREYIQNKIKQAEWVTECITQRKSTLLKVAREIVKRQEKFFLFGQGNLEPMRMAEIAAELGIHESTVSRAVREKYLQCCFGVYPLNYFFSTGKIQGSSISSEQVKQEIKRIIKGEDKKKPYSDQKITEKLKEDGIGVSRRTVAKYREEMKFGDAKRRKSF